MSDDEMEFEGDPTAVLLGEARPFDPATGMPAKRDGEEATAALGGAVDFSGMDVGPSRESWMLTLAEKNASNTADLKAPHMLGIDEAGRGPVLGSMVYGVAWCPIDQLEQLKSIKVADSKTLTFAQREALFRTIQSTPWLGYEVDVITADRLSREMLRRTRVNLNAISHDSAIALIHAVLAHGVNVREVYVDTVGDAGKYQEKLQGIFPGIAITVSKKADSLFPIVSAASIAAKVTRDLNLDVWSFPEERAQPNGVLISPTSYPLHCSRKLGSGYPGDPLTKAWLQNHLDPVFGYPSLVRFSWGTTKKILKTDAVQVEWGDEDDDEDDPTAEAEEAGTQKMGQFFAAAEAPSAASKVVPQTESPASAASPPLTIGNPNNKRFSALHESLTSKQFAIKQTERVGWFQQHQMHVATTF